MRRGKISCNNEQCEGRYLQFDETFIESTLRINGAYYSFSYFATNFSNGLFDKLKSFDNVYEVYQIDG